MTIVTKGGDQGETGLLYGGRVSKADLRCEAYGTVDEAVSALGVARAQIRNKRIKSYVRTLQKELFSVGAELATDDKFYYRLTEHFAVVTPEMVTRLEGWIGELEPKLTLPRGFIIPGGSAASAALDMARALVRRAERRAVKLKQKDLIRNPEVIRYLNRASDLLWVLARYVDRDIPPEMLTGSDEP